MAENQDRKRHLRIDRFHQEAPYKSKKQNRVHVGGATKDWTLGQACFRGSIHSDMWAGTAADLLSMRHIAVFPVTGWWRTRRSQERWESRLKYSLIVTLESANPALDIYTEIENQIKVPVELPT